MYAGPLNEAEARLDAGVAWGYGRRRTSWPTITHRPTAVRGAAAADQPAARQVLLQRILRPRGRRRPVALLPAPGTRAHAAVAIPYPPAGRFVSDDWRGREADLLFSVEREGSGSPVLVYVLLEHQSTPTAGCGFGC